jgi:hypothetical protein
VSSLYRPENLRFAGVALIALGFAVGGVLGKLLEGAVCARTPPVSWIMVAGAALAAAAFDLGYRYRFRAAAQRVGWKRFIDPMLGGRLLVFPLWVVGLAGFAGAVARGLEDGFC